MNQRIEAVKEEIKKAVRGKDDTIQKVLAAILAGGHILLEDIPGVGKTTLAMSIAKTLELSYKRVQFTPEFCPVIYWDFLCITRKITALNIRKELLCVICFWRMKSTEHLRKPSQHY